MRKILLLRLFIVSSVAILTLSCGFFGLGTGTAGKPESLADIKKRLWREAPSESARPLKTALDFKINQNTPIGPPASFALSNEGTLYVDDNLNGKLFKISSDLGSIEDFGTTRLINPTKIRASGSNIFVYDNSGINIFDKNGNFVKTVRPFFRIEDFALLEGESYVTSLAELKPDNGNSILPLLNSDGKRVDSIGGVHPSDYRDIENKAFVEVCDGRLYVCYRYEPLVEIYDLKTKNLLHRFSITAPIFPHLSALKQDKKFTNPEPGVFKIAKFAAGLKVI